MELFHIFIFQQSSRLSGST